jgi:hypothetical protein
MDIALIADKNNYGRPVTYQVIEWKSVPTSERGLIVGKVYISKRLQPGEVLYETGTYLPIDVIVTSNPKLILTSVFEDF